MNAFRLALFGHDVTHNPHPNHPEAVGNTIDNGGIAQLRQPASMRPFFDKLASGEPVALTDSEVAQAGRLGIALNDATLEVREREAWAAHAAGASTEIINARVTTPHYRPAKPVKITGSFIPTKTSY